MASFARRRARRNGITRAHRSTPAQAGGEGWTSAGRGTRGGWPCCCDRTGRPRPESLARLAAALRLTEGQRGELAAASAGAPPAPDGQWHSGGGLRLSVLGPLTAWRDGAAVDLGPARQRAVLGLLALHAGAVLPRAALIDALWPQNPPPTAVVMVQAQISRIRRLLAPAPGAAARLSWDGPGYRLGPGALWLDLTEFTRLAARARQAAAAGDLPGACARYERALALWRGQPLEDIELLYGHPAVTGLARQRDAVVIDYAGAAASAGLHDRVTGHLEALTAREPLDERAHAWLMITLAATGRQAAALRLHTDLTGRLDHELGVSPGPDLSAAHLRVLRQEMPGREPAVAHPVPRQLPGAVPRFAGRAAELAALNRVLDQAAGAGGTVVISAIGGTAGVGKTALAVHWAHQVAGLFPDGQLHVNLRGFGPGGPPMEPAAAMRLFLDGLGPRRTGCPPTRRPRPRYTAACWPAGGCSSCSTTPATLPRCGRCSPVRRAAWSW